MRVEMCVAILERHNFLVSQITISYFYYYNYGDNCVRVLQLLV